MHAIKIYVTRDEFDKLIKEHLNDRDAERFAGCEWAPIRVEVTDVLDVEVTAVPVR
jgi:hypothetical protein